MRSSTRAALAATAAALLAGCGDYSTEDLRFLAAVPTRDDLKVEVPAQADPSSAAAKLVLAPACRTGLAETWLWAKPTSDQLNATVEFLIGLVDVVRRYPPGWRGEDARGWGPFPDGKHPGRELRVFLVRTFPDGPEAPPRFAYAFEAREAGTGADWTAVLAGTFEGASATLGRGVLVLDFDALWGLGMADPDAPHGRLFVEYDRAATPRSIALALDQDGFGLEGFGYRFQGWPDRTGTFDYAFRNAGGDLLVVSAAFDAAGQGRAAVLFQTAGGFSGGYQQCWDGGACLTYVNDPLGYSCGAPPCSLGAPEDCAAVPAPPF